MIKCKEPEHIGTLDDQVQTVMRDGVENIGSYSVLGIGTQHDALIHNLDGGLSYSDGPQMEARERTAT
ncbi:hypothetical protein [Xanthomonas nasturtii]|uniref:hypothetical protein n=1 Tax=Xanthomonas nasturtii TaxID=1843581 RepID=UPI002011DDBA|nr:hypothetical protein [Xanthomonas nasturtii]MCL1561418.1 hypothetical protein [Xanthomonas nasturtii]